MHGRLHRRGHVLLRGSRGASPCAAGQKNIGRAFSNCWTEGFIGEDMFFYAGPGALRRAQLAKKILEERFRIVGLKAEEYRVDFLGLNAIHGAATPADAPEPYEIAVRVAARTATREEAVKVGREVDGMAVSGIAHTGKRVPHADRTREVIGVWSSLVPREQVPSSINYFES